jgi:hypothetical protein
MQPMFFPHIAIPLPGTTVNLEKMFVEMYRWPRVCMRRDLGIPRQAGS